MPSFAELKAKAAGVTSSGVQKVQNVRDRNTSVPMKNTNWDPYSGEPPPPPPPPRTIINKSTKPALAALPPPPSRTGSTASSSTSRNASASPQPPPPVASTKPSLNKPPVQAKPPLPIRKSSSPVPQLPPRNSGVMPPPPPPPRSGAAAGYSSQSLAVPVPTSGVPPPPPIKRSTRPDLSSHRVSSVVPAVAAYAEEKDIDWTNLSAEDKEVFFSWLDEFFANFVPPTAIPNSTVRPKAAHTLSLSHPPKTIYGSSALDLAHYFSRTTLWDTAWYATTAGPPIPPPLVGRTDHSFTSSWRSKGSNKTVQIGILFSDLSMFWGTLNFIITTATKNKDNVERSAAYLDRPSALTREELVAAHETYGETIAAYAESFVDSGKCCGRGECWDLANEALKCFKQYEETIPPPVPSISRTHGHLIFAGKAFARSRNRQGQPHLGIQGAGAIHGNTGNANTDRMEMMGRWRGGDDRVRRGDIVEWRKVRIGMKDRPTGSYYTLGDPDHTAVIVRDAVPFSSSSSSSLLSISKTKTTKTTLTDGTHLSPADLGILVVIEQSLGKLPERREYDLALLEEGEVWIYRPVGIQTYLGISGITSEPESLEGVPAGRRVLRLEV